MGNTLHKLLVDKQTEPAFNNTYAHGTDISVLSTCCVCQVSERNVVWSDRKEVHQVEPLQSLGGSSLVS